MLKDRELVTAENRNGVGGARFVLLAGFHDRCVGEPEWMLGVVTWKAMHPWVKAIHCSGDRSWAQQLKLPRLKGVPHASKAQTRCAGPESAVHT